MDCKYSGDFNEPHQIIKKRRVTEQAKINTLSVINNGKSGETFREIEAVRLMKLGRSILLLTDLLVLISHIIKINKLKSLFIYLLIL